MGRGPCWQVELQRPLLSCCFLQQSSHVVAVSGQGSSITLLDVSGAEPQSKPEEEMHESG